MNSTKIKKKTKSGNIPKPIKIKKENDHIIYPMEHYIDDRVELIRQIFSSLKPKTITNLAPEFLKKSKLEEIQEQCLNEILGISKKRLISIINSTKCPSDTDSSSDDDVNSIEEHISLEEISSESDIVEDKCPKAEKKGKQRLKCETDNENNKQFSVLELLELQARARAIRSQLALEPVTKIEVDTDSDDDQSKINKSAQTSAQSRKRKPNTANGTAKVTHTTKRPAKILTISKPNGESSAPASKPLKLKRNFRKQNQDLDDYAEIAVNLSRSTPIDKTKNTEPKKENRSPSPDVIPIIAVPETLCISDSDDEKTSISQPAKNPESLQILSVISISPPKKPEDMNEDKNTEQTGYPEIVPKETVIEETEEGEIVEEEVVTKSPNEDNTEKEAEQNIEQAPVETKNEDEPQTLEAEESKESSETSKSKPQSVNSSSSEDDTNDDVISLEGGDILNEMKEHLDEDEIEEIKGVRQVDEIINLDDSSDEEPPNKKESMSWNERWLKSSKVSKVLAASRLGNRVRNKIKESKKAKKLEEAALIESEQAKPPEPTFVSKHEDGSMEQYKELLETVQKKAD